MRLFVAVWPAEEVLDRLAAMDRPSELPGVRWTERAQWHVTLRFLGEVVDDVVPDATRAVTEAAAVVTPVTVSIGDVISRFGREVAHVEVRGLESWATAVATSFDRAGIGAPAERRPFIGHITLARARRRDPTAARSVAGLAGRSLPTGPSSWTASELALVRSELGRGGARYSNVAVVPVG